MTVQHNSLPANDCSYMLSYLGPDNSSSKAQPMVVSTPPPKGHQKRSTHYMETIERYTVASVLRSYWNKRGFTLIHFQRQAPLEFQGACRRLPRLCRGGLLGS